MDGLEIAPSFLVKSDLTQSSPELSIVIVSYNVKEELRECLLSLQGGWGFAEIVVVDNHSWDGTVAMVKREFTKVLVIENDRNRGFSSGANQGFQASRGKNILFLNPDTKVDSTDLKNMLAYLNANENAGIMGPCIVNAQGQRQYSARRFPGLQTAFSNSQSWLNRLWPANPWSAVYLCKDLLATRPSEVDWVSGSCILVRRRVFDHIGLLDPRFFMFIEDVDFCRRAKQKGWKVIYYPQVKIMHHQGRSIRQRQIKMLAEHHKSMYYYYRKHYEFHPWVAILVFVGLWLRLGTATLGHWMRH